MPVPALYSLTHISLRRDLRRPVTLVAAALIWIVLAQGTPLYAAQTDGLQEEFRVAAEKYNMPLGLLMAVGYVETRWEHHLDHPALDGGVGIMHLTGGEGGTLMEAARLTGLSEEALRVSRSANIEGAAAVLSNISHELSRQGVAKTTWKSTLERYSGISEKSVAEAYALDVIAAWREGRAARISTGEELGFPGDGSAEDAVATGVAPESDDYPLARWVPAYAGNYTAGRQYGPLAFIVIHDTEGSYYSAINWFQNPNSRASAHYVIRSADGEITQMVREANTAWHAGNWDYNVRSFGIEHEGYMHQPGWYTEAMYQSSAALSRHLADRYNLKKDRAYVIAHSEVPGATHQDPGPYWNWNYYMSLVRRDWAFAARVDNTDGSFEPVPAQIDPQHYWWTHPGGYGGSNTYGTFSVDQQTESYNSGTWTAQITNAGYYDVYAYVPYVDNNTPDTGSARYRVTSRDGDRTVTVSQRGITDRGVGGWAHVGKFYYDAYSTGRVHLSDYTGESGRNVWFDAVMWIPSTVAGTPPPQATTTPQPTKTPTRTPSRTPTRTPTRTNTPRPTSSPVPTDTPPPTNTPAPTFTPGPCGMRFHDLPDTHWSYTYVTYLYCRAIIGGYGDGTFRPHLDSTRGQFVKMLVAGMGWNLYNPVFPTFSDVAPGSPFYEYVETAALRGLLSGYPDGTFRPNNPLTRAQAAKLLTSAREWPPVNPAEPSFVDVGPGEWSYGYVEAAFARGVIGGYADRTFRPNAHVTRSQLAKMLALTLQAAAPDKSRR
jgi:hypothetical protein